MIYLPLANKEMVSSSILSSSSPHFLFLSFPFLSSHFLSHQLPLSLSSPRNRRILFSLWISGILFFPILSSLPNSAAETKSAMRRCELCKAKARMYCASDRASLCWDCDAAVHSANFLVARHSRNLLCNVCQSPTPWAASGGKLGPTVSVCEQCAGREQSDDSGTEESEEEMEVEEEEEEEESQVVPWSPPPPAEAAASSSSDDESLDDEDAVVSRKRFKIEV